MKLRTKWSKKARRDFEEAADYANKHSLAWLETLVDEVDSALHTIIDFPSIGKHQEDNSRIYIMPFLPLSILYEVRLDHIRILRLLHHARFLQ